MADSMRRRGRGQLSTYGTGILHDFGTRKGAITSLGVATSKKVVVPRVDLSEPREYRLDVDLPAGPAEGGDDEDEHDQRDGSSTAQSSSR